MFFIFLPVVNLPGHVPLEYLARLLDRPLTEFEPECLPTILLFFFRKFRQDPKELGQDQLGLTSTDILARGEYFYNLG